MTATKKTVTATKKTVNPYAKTKNPPPARPARRTLEGQSVDVVRAVLTTTITRIRDDRDCYICNALAVAVLEAPPAVAYTVKDGILFELEQELGEPLDDQHAAKTLPHPRTSEAEAKRARLRVLRKLLKRLCPTKPLSKPKPLPLPLPLSTPKPRTGSHRIGRM